MCVKPQYYKRKNRYLAILHQKKTNRIVRVTVYACTNHFADWCGVNITIKTLFIKKRKNDTIRLFAIRRWDEKTQNALTLLTKGGTLNKG